MRTISWKHPLIALFIGGAMVAACSSDTTAPPAEDSGTKCGNGKVDKGEECDPKATQESCMTATMGSKPSGTVKCKDDCTQDLTGCKAAAGAGGGGGMGGGTGGIVGTGGMGGKGGGGGKGGTTGKDGGPDAMPDSGPDGSKPDSGAGGSGGTAPVDSGKG